MELVELVERVEDAQWINQQKTMLKGRCPKDRAHVLKVMLIGGVLRFLCLSGCASEALAAHFTTNGSTPAPALPAPTNGKRSYESWRLELGYAVKGVFDAVPENDRTLIASGTEAGVVDTVVKQIVERLDKRPLWPLPEGLSQTEVEEDIVKLATDAYRVFQNAYLPATTNGHLPDVPKALLFNDLALTE